MIPITWRQTAEPHCDTRSSRRHHSGLVRRTQVGPPKGPGFYPRSGQIECYHDGVKTSGTVALTVGSVQRRLVPELRHFHWLLKINQMDVIKKRSYVGPILPLVRRPPRLSTLGTGDVPRGSDST